MQKHCSLCKCVQIIHGLSSRAGSGRENTTQGCNQTVATAESLPAPHHPPIPAACRSMCLVIDGPETLHPNHLVPQRYTRMGQPSSPQSKLPRSESGLAEVKRASYTCFYGGSSHPHHTGPSLPPALHHLLLPELGDLGRKVEEEAPGRGGSRPLLYRCKVPINLEEKALGINFPFITHIVTQAPVLPSDILNESATGHARRMMDYGAGGGKTPCKKSTAKQTRAPKSVTRCGKTELPPFTCPPPSLCSDASSPDRLLTEMAGQMLGVYQGGQMGKQNSSNQEKNIKEKKKQQLF